LGVSATASGNLLTPLMMGAVTGSILTGQLNLRLKSYKPSAVAGSILVAAGMIVFAQMDANTVRLQVVIGMILAGFGMGLLNPVYTVAVQNVAPRHQMGAATASTTFFRSIGSTMGVAIFGSVLLTNYHHDFAAGVPPGAPAQGLQLFSNPLMLAQMRPQLESAFGPSGQDLLKTLLANVRTSLIHGLQLIFISSAVLMTLSILLHVFLKNIPLRGKMPDAEQPAH
jgi:MFS family permease